MAKAKIQYGSTDDGKPKTIDFDTTIKIGDKRVDFAKAAPISLGDWLELEKKGCVIVNAGERKVNLGEAQHALDFIAHFARKADETIGPMDVLALPITTVTKLASYIQQATSDATDPN